MKIVQKLDEKIAGWFERHENAVSVGFPLITAGLGSAMLLSMDPSNFEGQSAEVLRAAQEPLKEALVIGAKALFIAPAVFTGMIGAVLVFAALRRWIL